MQRMRRFVRVLLAAAIFAHAAAVLFVVSATKLSGDTVGTSLALATAAA